MLLNRNIGTCTSNFEKHLSISVSACVCQNKVCYNGEKDCDWYQAKRFLSNKYWEYKNNCTAKDGPLYDSENKKEGRRNFCYY